MAERESVNLKARRGYAENGEGNGANAPTVRIAKTVAGQLSLGVRARTGRVQCHAGLPVPAPDGNDHTVGKLYNPVFGRMRTPPRIARSA